MKHREWPGGIGEGEFQLILNPIRDWNSRDFYTFNAYAEFQLILNPIRDWNTTTNGNTTIRTTPFQLILNPIRDWNSAQIFGKALRNRSN